MYGGNPVPVFQPRGFSPEPPSQGSGMSRPSAKSIYMQRKEYAESVSKQQDKFQYRVEHLFTFVLDGKEMSRIEDCVERLKNMDSKGKVWGQDMIMQVQANHLQLCDIETKEVLESVHLSSIGKTRAVLDSCVYDSLLIILVQDPSQRAPQAFLFQCEETGAQEVVNDLERAIQQGGDAFPPYKEPQMDIRSHLENILGQGHPGSIKRPTLSPMQSNPPPPEFPPPEFNNYEVYDNRRPSPTMPFPRDEAPYKPMQPEPEQIPPEVIDMDRDTEIFNHVAADIETFIYKVGSALPKDDGSKKKKKKNAAKNLVANIPTVDEYISCLQKIKYGFNLLGKLDGHLKNPPASDFVHSLFSSLGFMVSQYPPNIPSTVLSPLLTEKALQLLGSVVTPNEDQLWASLGDAWNVSRSKWPNGNQIPPYFPEFYDGWQPLPPVPSHSQSPPVSRQLSRNNSERFPPGKVNQRPPEQDNRPWSTPPIRSAEPPPYMRVIYDFMARNNQELSVMKGDMVEVTNKSGQWWKVKNSRNEEGHVPQNVLEPVDGQKPTQNMRGPPSLDMKSRPEEVKAWLQYKGFSKMTVQSLGMFNGALLLGMKQDDIRAICPEEGGRVFFQLQSVRSTIALASEPEYSQYGARR